MTRVFGKLRAMQPFPDYVQQLKKDVRLLRIDKDRLTRAHQTQKQKVEQLEKQLKEQAKRIRELEKENEHLKQEREQSNKTKNRYQVALFDHGNFRHPTTAMKKKKGGQAGHADTNRESRQQPLTVEKQHLFAPQCGSCGQALARVKATRHKALVDIVLHPQVVNILLESERQWCGHCHQEVVARDERSLPFTEYGLNVFLVVMVLRFRSHASLQNIASVLEISHGLRLSKSSIGNLLAQAKRYLRGQYDQLIAAVRAGEVMYADETGWLVHGQKAWMWLIANDQVTVYFAAESRGGGIAREVYGESHALCMHDGYAAYTNALPQQNHLYCWAHLLRFAHEETILDPPDSQAAWVREQLVRVYHLQHDTAVSGSADLEARLRAELDQVLAVESESDSLQHIQARVRLQYEGLIRALLCTRDGTNNLAERELRPMVLTRKISNGSDTFAGMETSAIVGSVLQTLAKQDAPMLCSLQQSLREGVQEHSSQYQHPVSVDFS